MIWPFHRHRWYPYCLLKEMPGPEPFWQVKYVCRDCGDTKAKGAWMYREGAEVELQSIIAVLDKEELTNTQPPTTSEETPQND